MKTYYITRYALTKGIETLDTDRRAGSDYIYPKDRHTSFKIGLDAFETMEEAISNAGEKKIKKLQSLDKQMKKISALEFNPELLEKDQ